MDPRRFDSLTRSLAAATTRRGFLGTLAAIGAGLAGARATEAKIAQAQCGNVSCRNNHGKCNPGCVCCVYGNGNSRCLAPGSCSGTPSCPPGQVPDPVDGCVAQTTTTTTAAPTTTTTTTSATTAAPCPPGTTRCGGKCVDTSSDEDNCGACGNVCPNLTGVLCADGACCQIGVGPQYACSAALPCCQGGTGEIRCAGGHCCGGTGYTSVLCAFGDSGGVCCGQCVGVEPECNIGVCLGFCA